MGIDEWRSSGAGENTEWQPQNPPPRKIKAEGSSHTYDRLDAELIDALHQALLEKE